MNDSPQPDATAHPPPFVDPESYKLWLENVPLANVVEAQRQLLGAVGEFNQAALKGAVRLATLEALREAVKFVQLEQARRFTNRALPMVDAESTVFEATIQLWDAMRAGYLRCLEGCIAGESGLRSQRSLVCQRILTYLGLRMFHHYRAYRQVPAVDWRTLNEIYAAAERLKVNEIAVKDYLNRDIHDSSPRIAYMRAMLMGLVNPNELSQRQLTFVGFILERWAEKVEISTAMVEEGADASPLWVDLTGERFAERRPPEGRELRYLDVRRLAKSLRNRIGLLRKGEPPSKLGLGKDCVQPSCEQLLVFLYRQWCRPKAPRAYQREHVTDVAQACNDMAAIHYYIAGKVFRQPGEKHQLSKSEHDQIATFGRVSTRDEDDYSVVRGFLLEHWQLEDESVQGLRMVRRAGNPGKRYAHGQLVGVRPTDTKRFLLAQVRWLMQGDGGDLHTGLSVLAGTPAAIAVRPVGVNVAATEKYTQALSLTGVSSLGIPTSLVVPAGWFKPGRVIEAYFDKPARARLNEVIDRGVDFEQVVYELLPN